MMDFRFELMTKEHGKEIMDIFNYYIENSCAAYLEETLPYGFFDKFLEITQGYPAYVIKKNSDGEVIGFCFLRAYNSLPVFRETAEITYFIKKEEVGKGIGKKALDMLESEGGKMGIKYLLASISSYNDQSIRFHKKHGFRECGTFLNIGKKKGKRFDVVWMQKQIK